jgi:hypothetical protein
MTSRKKLSNMKGPKQLERIIPSNCPCRIIIKNKNSFKFACFFQFFSLKNHKYQAAKELSSLKRLSNIHNKILRLVSSVKSALLVLALAIEQLKISSRYTITNEILSSWLTSASTIILWLS